VLDRRIYDIYQGPAFPPSPDFNPKKAPLYTVLVEMDVKPEAEKDFNQWYDEEHIPLLAKVPGWVRSRRFVLQDESCVGDGELKRTSPPPKYLAIHEWATQEKLESEAYKHAVSTPWRARVQETLTRKSRREMELYRRWNRD
jgi:hypothetical protein